MTRESDEKLLGALKERKKERRIWWDVRYLHEFKDPAGLPYM